MVQIRFSLCLVWFLPASVYFPPLFSSCLVLSARILASEKYPRHDKNWWFWNQEAKGKPGTFDDTQKKGEREIKLEFKRSVHPFTPDVNLLRSLLSKEPVTNHMNKKRWLSGTFGFCGKKNQHKEARKWLIDSQRSGLSNTPVIQDPWTMSYHKMMHLHQRDYETDIPARMSSAGQRFKALRKYNIQSKNVSLQHQNTNKHRAVNVDNILFGSSNHVYNKENNLDSVAYRSQQPQRFPEQSMKTYSNQRPPSVYQQVWNKSHDPVWDRFMTPFGELKFNPLRHPYPFHDSRSSIKWYTTPSHGLVRTSEPPLKEQQVDNDRRSLPSTENENEDFDEMMESKGVAKSKDKKAKEVPEQRHREYELMPKIYALNQLRNGKKSFKKYNDHYGWFSDSVTNPIIVPGFKRKHIDDAEARSPEDVQVSLRPYMIRTEERENPFEDEFVQVSRANRNQTKNILGMNDNRQGTTGSIPLQMPSPYAFPGGVNISILVPNPPAPSSHETLLSTMTSTSTDKNIKKKKERKKKVKTEDELREGLLSEPRSLVSARMTVKKFPYAEKTGINPLIGNDDRRMSAMNLIGPQLNNTMDNMKHSMFDLKKENFNLLSHIRNLTMNQLDWDTPLFGMQTEKLKKPADYGEDDNDDDEIRMLYDEHSPSTTNLPSDDKHQTVSFSWYRLTDYAPRTFSVQDTWGIGKISTPPNIKRIPGFELRGSGRVKPRMEDDEYVIGHEPSRINYTSMENERTFKRSARGERGSDDSEVGGISLKKYGIPLNMVKYENQNENEHSADKARACEPRDQWDALDEDLKSEMGVNTKNVAWCAKNRKRETDYYDHQANDEQGYYRLSIGGSSLRNPTNLIMSAFRAKSNKPREREYYDDIPEERTREQMRPNDAAPSTYPK